MAPNKETQITGELRVEEKKLRKITWEELEKHNTTNDYWIGINDKVYDVTKWQHEHPGGTSMIELLAGKDATYVFDSYHLSTTSKLLGTKKVPCVGELVSTKLPKYSGKSKFYPTLKKKVEKYFKDQKIKDTRAITGWVILNSLFIQFMTLLTLYFSMYHVSFGFLSSILFGALGGVFHYLSMTHIYHDISHGSYGHNQFIYKFFTVFGSIFTGHSVMIWSHRHVVGHHAYTNVSGVDPDIGIYKVTHKKPIKNYRAKISVLPSWFQPFIFFFVVMHMKIDDWFSYFRGSMEHSEINNRTWGLTFRFLFYKLLYFSLRLILPYLLGTRSLFTIIPSYLAYELVGGYLFGLFSQLSHVTEEAEFFAESPVDRDWGEAQITSAVDYGHGSWFWTYVSGYLNYQVVHHLFPSVAPYHYPKLAPIIIETCKEFNINYKVSDFLTIYKGYLTHLKKFQYVRHRSPKKIENSWSPVDMIDVWTGWYLKRD